VAACAAVLGLRGAKRTQTSRTRRAGGSGRRRRQLNDARTLLQLQNFDLEIDAADGEFGEIAASLGESPELISAREAHQQAQKALDTLRSTQRDLEFEAESLSTRIKAEDKQMYDGRGRGSRELEGLRKSVESLKASRRAIEDRILDTMGAIEQAQIDAVAREADHARVDAEWTAGQADLARRRDALQSQVGLVKAQRDQLAASLDRALLARYEDLRKIRRGRAVALIERNTCQGCRITLPLTVVQHARAGRTLVPCPSCERFLVPER
jgi:uncharacterized protein